MRTYSCLCGNTLFFDNSSCLACGREVGFCPACRLITALVPDEQGGFHCGHEDCGVALVKCENYLEHDVCNRCVRAETAAAEPLCDCCRFNDLIPDLTVKGNLLKWYRLEAAKRRLFYDLGELGLPYGTEEDGIEPPLSFDFKADVIPKKNYWRGGGADTERVYTGHANGKITINIREACDVEREKLRVDLGEAHRTLIGHFRHEVGHFYWDMLIKGRREEEFIAVFGDHNNPTYAEALERHYEQGPPADWQQSFVSAYATMHPWEDFAETWALYLDMTSALDTAAWQGFGGTTDAVHKDVEPMIKRYQQLGVALNEINRSMGLLDLVPEVIVPPVVEKLRYIHNLVRTGHDENGALKPADEQSPAIVTGQSTTVQPTTVQSNSEQSPTSNVAPPAEPTLPQPASPAPETQAPVLAQ